MEQPNPKTFFERYQTFFSIIIAAVVIAGGIVLARTMPTTAPAGTAEQGQTEDQIRSELIKTAKKLSLDSKALGICLDQKTNETKINDATTLAAQSGVQGTPTFFIIKRTYGPDDRITSEKQIPVIGARDATVFTKAIEQGITPSDQPAVTGEKIVLSDTDHWMGPRRASVIIVEYADVDCVFCKQAKPTIDKLLSNHPEYAFVYRHAPIVSRHPWAAYKAEALECITTTNGPEGFWKLLNVIAK